MKSHRIARVAEVIREVASETILFELRDPRVKNVTVTRTEVSGDLQRAKIYVSVMGTEREQNLCLHGLQHSAGFIQSRLADRLKSRFTPVLTFVIDQGVKNSLEVSRLIDEALHPKTAQATADPHNVPEDDLFDDESDEFDESFEDGSDDSHDSDEFSEEDESEEFEAHSDDLEEDSEDLDDDSEDDTPSNPPKV